MKHAGAQALAHLASLLDGVRRVAGTALAERKEGTFYRQSAAFLHFHEDPAGLFADLKQDDGTWQRFEISLPAQHAVLLRAVAARLR